MSSRWMAVLQQRQTSLSKKNATCQKCLQKGHWTYECKNERKYVQRMSRSHELNKHLKQTNKRKLAEANLNLKRRKLSSSSGTSSSSSSSDNSTSSSSSESSSDESDSASSSDSESLSSSSADESDSA